MFDWRKFLEDIAIVNGGNYATAFKLLGFVLYIGQFGADSLLAGDMVSLPTYYRYVEIIKAAGWGSLLAEVRAVQALKEYTEGLVKDQGLQSDQVAAKLSGLLEGV